MSKRKPPTLEKSFASHPKASCWSARNTDHPKDCFISSKKKRWFDCDKCHHSFETGLDSISQGVWCPYCKNLKRCDDTVCMDCYNRSFASHANSHNWSPKNFPATPRQVAKCSNNKYIFDCKCGSEYTITLNQIPDDIKFTFCKDCRKKCSKVATLVKRENKFNDVMKQFRCNVPVELGYKKEEDWYVVSRQLIEDNGGSLLLRKYNNSPTRVVKAMFPKYKWLDWKFKKSHDGLWDSMETQQKYVKWLGNELGYETIDRWYELTTETLYANHGGSLLHNYYSGSQIQFVKAMFPEYEWLEWEFVSGVSNGYWKDIKNHKLYIEWLGDELGYETMKDWYKITGKLITDNHGDGLLSYYNSSPIQFVKAMFPGYPWLEWKFANGVGSETWLDIENHKRYVNWLGDKLGYETVKDWYKITGKLITDNHGDGLLSYYNSSPIQLVKAMFPEYEWLEWKFITVSKKFWSDHKNHVKYMKWLGDELGYTKEEDWYGTSFQSFRENGGRHLFKLYHGGTIHKLVKVAFPDYDWHEWKFVSTGDFWHKPENQRRYMEWLGNKLGYETMDDWYKTIKSDLYNNLGSTLLTKFYGCKVSSCIMVVFPEHKWDAAKFKKNYSRGQIEWLEYLICSTPDIRHQLNNEDGEFTIPDTRYRADGYSLNENCIYEYHGDFWHGNPNIYDKNSMNPITRTTYGDLWEKTLEKQRCCENYGFAVHYIWESDWNRGKNAVISIQRLFRK